MSVPFNSQSGLIIVDAVIQGPNGDTTVPLGLDTGAELTVVSATILVSPGYDLSLAPQHVQMVTASGVLSVPRIPVGRLSALGHDYPGLPVLAHTLPPAASVAGLLGLDILRGKTLKIDFRAGLIDLQ
jgi:hypothetical protein